MRELNKTMMFYSGLFSGGKMIKVNSEITNKEKHLISHQTREDIISSIMGFEEMCIYKLKCSKASFIPSRVNSDVTENIFCQQRTLHNGANTNPTYLGYCHSVNSVILGQTSISRKSNAGGGEGTQLSQAVKANKKILKKEAIFESHDEKHVKDDTYRAVRMKKITLLMNVVFNLHNLQDIKCDNPHFELKKEIKYGSCVKCIYKCIKCKFTSPRVNLYDEIETLKPGPNPGELTRMFASALQENKKRKISDDHHPLKEHCRGILMLLLMR
ncbi:unnamed protein product [Mytilus coruscus]|uniref:Mutator-like transposase domain-containing protein n=1 Tax=Mytilus coruscus TaxID=42192 RepID=A0A6J8DZF6_MYTCO|nr:unnamed protein product [Mytilus coruscus]